MLIRIQLIRNPGLAYHFDADSDPNFQFEADPDPQHWYRISPFFVLTLRLFHFLSHGVELLYMFILLIQYCLLRWRTFRPPQICTEMEVGSRVTVLTVLLHAPSSFLPSAPYRAGPSSMLYYPLMVNYLYDDLNPRSKKMRQQYCIVAGLTLRMNVS